MSLAVGLNHLRPINRVQVTIFPDHRSDRNEPDLHGAQDFDLDLIENLTLDGHTQELMYRPTLRH